MYELCKTFYSFDSICLCRKPNKITSSNYNSQLRDELEQRAIRFPYSIKVLKNGKPQKLFYYDEAAEMDYDLNWAVDTHWKVFATVLGYCNSEYTIREPATFMSFYSLYTEDVLDLIMDVW